MLLEEQVPLVTVILTGLAMGVTFITDNVIPSVRPVMDQATTVVSHS